MSNPFKIMKDPRVFMRQLMEGERSSGWWLAGIVGLLWCYTEAMVYDLGSIYPFGWIIFWSLILAVPIGYLIVYMTSFFLFWTSKLFKGNGSFEGVTQAYLRTRIVDLPILILWVLAIGIHGLLVFTKTFWFSSSEIKIGVHGYKLFLENFVSSGDLLPIVVLISVISSILTVWQLVIFLHSLGEVLGVSAWIALCPAVITGLIMMFIMWTWGFIGSKLVIDSNVMLGLVSNPESLFRIFKF